MQSLLYLQMNPHAYDTLQKTMYQQQKPYATSPVCDSSLFLLSPTHVQALPKQNKSTPSRVAKAKKPKRKKKHSSSDEEEDEEVGESRGVYGCMYVCYVIVI